MALELEHTPRLTEADAGGLLWPEKAFALCHDAWESLLQQVQLPIGRIIAEGAFGIPLAHVELDPVAPLRAVPMRVRVAIRKLGERSIEVGYELKAAADGALLARALTVHVCIDRKTGRPIAMPDSLRTALAPHLEPVSP
jgi:acyl-CoA thioesterase FadM